MTSLHWRGADDVTLADALTAAAGALSDTAIGLASTTAWHGFVRRSGTGLHTLGRAINLAEVFEARMFDGIAELRWLNERDGFGRAILLAEDQMTLALAGSPFGEQHEEPVEDTCDQQLMLWGRPTAPVKGWVTLQEHRIGHLPVPGLDPLPGDSSHDPVLWLREYIAMDCHGNAYVLDERLCGPGWAPVRGKGTES